MLAVATILAVESRRDFAESLRDKVALHMPVHLSIADSANSLEDAFQRSKELMEFATLQNAQWHLYLEDDQELTDHFFSMWHRLLLFAERENTDLIYLTDRAIPIGQLGWLGFFRANRIRQPVAGSHGLLYRTAFIESLIADTECIPVDHWFWKHIDPHKNKLVQILDPVLARHVGSESTLHQYADQEHLMRQPTGL